MYENIVKALRCCTTYDCPPDCPRQGYGKGCITALKKDAANAIEELEHKYSKALSDLVRQNEQEANP